MTRRKFIGWAGSATLLGLLPTPFLAADTRVITGPAFGSTWRLVLADPGAVALARARIEKVVAHIDALLSPFRPDSDLGRFNESGSAELSPTSRFVLAESLRLASESEGAFDPTTAPLARRFGFGCPEIAATRPSGQFEAVRLAGDRVTTKCAGLSLDLCGIAKGHALDEIVRELDGLEFLFELGGEVAARGRHMSGRRWRIGIERPGSPALQRIIEIDRGAIATSGDSAQGIEVGGVNLAHVVDARTGRPVENPVASVTVHAETGRIADGLATAAMVLGSDAARPLLAAHRASALFLVRHGSELREIDVHQFLKGACP